MVSSPRRNLSAILLLTVLCRFYGGIDVTNKRKILPHSICVVTHCYDSIPALYTRSLSRFFIFYQKGQSATFGLNRLYLFNRSVGRTHANTRDLTKHWCFLLSLARCQSTAYIYTCTCVLVNGNVKKTTWKNSLVYIQASDKPRHRSKICPVRCIRVNNGSVISSLVYVWECFWYKNWGNNW